MDNYSHPLFYTGYGHSSMFKHIGTQTMCRQVGIQFMQFFYMGSTPSYGHGTFIVVWVLWATCTSTISNWLRLFLYEVLNIAKMPVQNREMFAHDAYSLHFNDIPSEKNSAFMGILFNTREKDYNWELTPSWKLFRCIILVIRGSTPLHSYINLPIYHLVDLVCVEILDGRKYSVIFSHVRLMDPSIVFNRSKMNAHNVFCL